jgi:hypothetical protein
MPRVSARRDILVEVLPNWVTRIIAQPILTVLSRCPMFLCRSSTHNGSDGTQYRGGFLPIASFHLGVTCWLSYLGSNGSSLRNLQTHRTAYHGELVSLRKSTGWVGLVQRHCRANLQQHQCNPLLFHVVIRQDRRGTQAALDDNY